MKCSANNKNVKKVILSLVVSIFSIVTLCVSCQNDENKAYSFQSSINKIDVYIKCNQTSEALSLLKKSEKFAYDPFSQIGLYKRYNLLGEKALAEKTLRKAIKKFPKSNELLAVYGNYLLRDDRIVEAEKLTKPLSGTKYGSIYSEAVLKKNSSNSFAVYLTKDFSLVYKDIYNRTYNSAWLVNAALVEVANGEYLAASLLQEPIIKNNIKIDSKEALFWATVQFDAANYDICLKNVALVTENEYKPDAVSIASDCYMILDETDRAEEIRSNVINSESSIIPDIVAVNSSIWSYKNKDYQRSYDLLMGVLNRNPEYAPALLTYGKIAWIDSQPIQQTDLEKTLRQTTLRTEVMRVYDERPRFNIDDAIHRLLQIEEKYQNEQKLNRKNAEVEINAIDTIDSLIVERISLFLRQHKDLPIKARTAEIWKTLEKNESGLNLYPPKLLFFTVQKLISYGYSEDARTLFTNYISAKYLRSLAAKKALEEKSKSAENNESDANIEVDIFGGERRVKAELVPESVVRLAFGDKVANVASSMSIWEVEIAAYFSLIDGNIEAAKRLYEFVLFESGDVVNSYNSETKNVSFENISTLAASSSAVNLSMIYSSLGDKKSALALYGLAAGRCEDVRIKSKILQRLAMIQMGMGDMKQAKLSIEYSLSLDPQNADARLFKRQLLEQ